MSITAQKGGYMDQITIKYNELKKKGIDLGSETAGRNQFSRLYPYVESVVPYDFQCYTYGVIILSTPEGVWMSGTMFSAYIQGLVKQESIGAPEQDMFEREVVFNNTKTKFRYLFCTECLLYLINGTPYRIYYYNDTIREFMNAGYLPESLYTTFTFSSVEGTGSYYYSGDFAIVGIYELKVGVPYGHYLLSNYYKLKKEYFDYLLKAIKFMRSSGRYIPYNHIKLLFETYSSENDHIEDPKKYPCTDGLEIKLMNISPNNKENYWSKSMRGICRGKKHWYITERSADYGYAVQKGGFWRIPINEGLSVLSKKVSWIENDFYLGDCDCYNGYLFIPVYNGAWRTDGQDRCATHVAVYDANTLEKVATADLFDKNNKTVYDVNWLAINPQNGKLYLSQPDRFDQTPVYVYDIDFEALEKGKQFLKISGEIYLDDMYMNPHHFTGQYGGCFDHDGHLYFVNKRTTMISGADSGIWVYTVPKEVSLSSPVRLKCIAKSGIFDGFMYPTDDINYDSRGVTFRNIGVDKKTGRYKGYLYAAIVNYSDGKATISLYKYRVFWEKCFDLERFFEENK